MPADEMALGGQGLASGLRVRAAEWEELRLECNQHDGRELGIIRSAVAVDFESATLSDLKEGTRLFLQRHCKAVLAQCDPGIAV